MASTFRCPRGHTWEDLFDDAPSLNGAGCPVCGAAGGEVISGGIQQTRVVPALRGESRAAPLPPMAPSRILESGLGLHVPRPAGSATLVEGGPRAPAGEGPVVPGYEILGELGRGGMGVVYKARQVGLDRLVALKMILAGAHAGERDRARFRAEAHAVARLQHPNIVQIYEVGEQDDRPYFSLEYVDGGSLAERLCSTPVPAHLAVPLVECLARAIHFAHERGIIHRDLKPHNILLDMRNGESATRPDGLTSAARVPPSPFGNPKITDFGLAKQLGTEQGPTASGAVVGTPGYMAPEQARGDIGELGPATDVYALGVILYQLLTGQLPFTGPTPMDVMLRLTTEEPLPPRRLQPKISPDLETICLKCLEKDPRKRYASALALADDCAAFLSREPIRARPIGRVGRLVRWVKRRPALAGLLAVSVLALGTLAVGGGWSHYAEQQRLGRARAETHDLLERAREAASHGHWEDARGLLAGIETRTHDEAALTDLRAAAVPLREEVEGQLAARGTLGQFARWRDEARFHATLAAGGSQAHLQATRQRAQAALDLVGLSAARQGEERWQSLQPFLAPDERTEVTRSAYELLLILAEAVAQPVPGVDDAQRQKNAREALRILEQGPRLGIRTHAYHLRRARYLEQAGAATEAGQERALAAARPASTAFDHYLVGEERYRLGDWSEALPELVESLRQQPEQFWARYFLALCYVQLGQPEPARNILTDCLGQRPEVVWIYLVRGFVEGQLGHYAAAETDFRKAEDLLGKEPDPEALYVLYNNRAVVRLGQNRFAEAVAELSRAAALQPQRYQAHATLAQAWQQQKRPDQALRSLDRAVEAARAGLRAGELEAQVLLPLYRQRARLRAEQKDLDGALRDLNEAVALEAPRSRALALAQRERGALLARAGRYSEAVAAYDAALTAQPGHMETLRRRADLLLKLRRHAEAARGFTDYLRSGGAPSARVYRCRALARARLGDQQGALADLTLALESEPHNAPLLVQRGQAYLACQAPELALRDFEEALRQDPQSSAAHAGRAGARLRLGLWAEAADDAEQFLRTGPVSAQRAYQAAGIFAQAAGRVGEGSPQGSLAREARARYEQRALELLRQALRQLPDEQRPAFWRDVVSHDAALGPIHHGAGFARLERQYASAVSLHH